MSTNDSASIVPLAASTELEKSISGLYQPLAEYIGFLGLPTEDVLSPISERRIIIDQLEDALSILPIDPGQSRLKSSVRTSAHKARE